MTAFPVSVMTAHNDDGDGGHVALNAVIKSASDVSTSSLTHLHTHDCIAQVVGSTMCCHCTETPPWISRPPPQGSPHKQQMGLAPGQERPLMMALLDSL